MNCAKCKGKTEVVDTRTDIQGSEVRRRRACLKCNQRFTTFERRNDTAPEMKVQIMEDAMNYMVKEIERAKMKLSRVRASKKALFDGFKSTSVNHYKSTSGE